MKNLKIFLLFVIIIIIAYVLYIFIQNRIQEEKKISHDNNLHDSIKKEEENILLENLEVEVDNLNFTSKTDKNESFSVKAKKSRKNNLGEYSMNNVNADIKLSEGNFSLKSELGFFNENSNYLMLQDNITGYYSGFLLHGSLFEFNFKENQLISKKSTKISNDKLTITGDKLIANDEKIMMEGNVKTIINPD